MTYTITYRNKDGRQEQMQIEAPDRSAVFAELSKRGISAIRVEEATGKVKPLKPASANGKKAPAVIKGLVAGAIVVVAAGAAWYFLSPKAETTTWENKGTKPGAAEKAKTSLAAHTNTVTRPVAEKKIPFWEQADTNGFTVMQQRKWRAHHMPPPAYTNDSALYESRLPYEIFNHPSENRIAFYLTHRPGDGLVGTPTFGKRFVNDFLKSLEHPIVVTKDDTPEQAQLKRDMIQVKIDLKQRLDAGEDISAIMLETHKEYQKLARYKSDIEKELREFRKNPDATLQDVDDFVTAANKMLEAKGIAPISLSPIARRMLMRRSGLPAK